MILLVFLNLRLLLSGSKNLILLIDVLIKIVADYLPDLLFCLKKSVCLFLAFQLLLSFFVRRSHRLKKIVELLAFVVYGYFFLGL